jgi:hypothetical protein
MTAHPPRTGARQRRRVCALSAAALLLAVCTSGCMGYRSHYDLDADDYLAEIAKLDVTVRGERSVRCVVNVATIVRGELAEPVSAEQPELEALAVRTVRDMQMWTGANVAVDVADPDYVFTFDVQVDVSQEPGLFSGLILPFYRVRRTMVRLQVLDDKGEPFANYVTSSETFEVRHILLFPFTPFYWPAWATGNARENLFEALAVKLMRDRKEFL